MILIAGSDGSVMQSESQFGETLQFIVVIEHRLCRLNVPVLVLTSEYLSEKGENQEVEAILI